MELQVALTVRGTHHQCNLGTCLMKITVNINGKLKTFNSPAKNFVEAMDLVRDMKGERNDVQVVSIEQSMTKDEIYKSFGQLPRGGDND